MPGRPCESATKRCPRIQAAPPTRRHLSAIHVCPIRTHIQQMLWIAGLKIQIDAFVICDNDYKEISPYVPPTRCLTPVRPTSFVPPLNYCSSAHSVAAAPRLVVLTASKSFRLQACPPFVKLTEIVSQRHTIHRFQQNRPPKPAPSPPSCFP